MTQRAAKLGLVVAMVLAVVTSSVAVPPAAEADVAPPAPFGLRAWPGVGGAGISWQPGPGYHDFVVYRRDAVDLPWTAVAEVPLAFVNEHHAIDRTLPLGASAEYAVAAVADGQESPLSAPVSITRPEREPTPGDIDAFTVDGPQSLRATVSVDRSRGEPFDVWSHWSRTWLTTPQGSDVRGSIDVPILPGPGRYELGPDGVALQVGAGLAHCTFESGTLDVVELAFDARRRPVHVTADVAGRCGSALVTATIRLGSAVPYRAAITRPAVVEVAEPPGVDALVDVDVRNAGREPIQLGTAGIDPPAGGEDGSAAWAVTGDGCAERSLAPGESCVVQVRFRATVPGERRARLVLPDDTASGARRVGLEGIGLRPPSAPRITAVAEAIGRVSVEWTPPPADITTDVSGGTIVSRRPVGGTTWTDLATIPEGTNGYVDTTPAPGARFEYRLTATGRGGHGTPSEAATALSRRLDLLGIKHYHTVALSSISAVSQVLRPQSNRSPAPSPDGRSLVVSRSDGVRGAHLWKVPTLGTDLGTQLTSLTGRAVDAAWSPDGKRIAFTLERDDAVSEVWVVPAAGGTPTRVATSAHDPTWEGDNQTLIVTDLSTAPSSRLARIDAAGRRSPIAGTDGATGPTVSPDGRFLAFTSNNRNLGLLRLDRSASPTTTSLEHGGYLEPAWQPDGRGVVAVAYQHPTGGNFRRGLVTLRVSGSPASLVRQGTDLGNDVRTPVYRAFGVHLTGTPPQLTGGTAAVAFAVTDAPAGTVTTCRLDGGPAQACTSPWRRTRLTTGTHSLVVEAVEPSGQRTVTGHRWRVDATPPKLTVPAPAAVTLGDRATISYRATDADGVSNYQVRYRRARSDRGFEAWVYPDSWRATTATTRSIGIARGYEYCFSVRARDTLGNLTAWSLQRCVSRPLDDRSLSASTGWSRATDAAALDGTVTTTTRKGAELRRGTVQARRVVVVATRCPSCGTADVFIGSTRVGRIDLRATTTERQQVITLPLQSKVLTGRLVIRTTSSSRVSIDGVALRRS